MVDVNKKIIKLLEQGVTLKTMKEETRLCASDIAYKLNELENKGYIIKRLFNEYDVKFILGDQPLTALQDNVTLVTSSKFTFMTISDTHLNNIYENLNLIKKVYQYAENNNIRYVIHLGDMIEGLPLDGQQTNRLKRFTTQEQVDFLTRNYPKSDNVDTLYILGNHDYRCAQSGIDISKIISRRRLDMHFLGYKNSRIRIGDRNILLQHPFTINKNGKYDKEIVQLYGDEKFDMVLRGHSHHNGIYVNDMGSLVVHVPICYSHPSVKYTSVYAITIKDTDKENVVELNNLLLSDMDDKLIPFNNIKYNLIPKQLVKSKQD